MNIYDILLLAAIGVGCFFAVRGTVRQSKRGGCAGCSGSGCAGCPYHAQEEKTDDEDTGIGGKLS